jgi:hypothetical protein
MLATCCLLSRSFDESGDDCADVVELDTDSTIPSDTENEVVEICDKEDTPAHPPSPPLLATVNDTTATDTIKNHCSPEFDVELEPELLAIAEEFKTRSSSATTVSSESQLEAVWIHLIIHEDEEKRLRPRAAPLRFKIWKVCT